ncbi:MAG: DUF6338 family protein [Planctomycetaceae bacterium]
MEFPTSEIVGLVYKLLPGFVAAWIFHGLTAHPKPTPFERVIQALIFTAFTQAIVIPIGVVLVWFGRHLFEIGQWTENSALFVGVIVAVALGFGFVWLANTNKLHNKLFELGITKRTAYPSEWYSSFHRSPRFVYLHLKNGRRIWGWPEEWPDLPANGHFVLQNPEWILDDNRRMPLLLTERILIPAIDVSMIEFEKPQTEWTFDPNQQQQIEAILTSLQKSDEGDDEGKREVERPKGQ